MVIKYYKVYHYIEMRLKAKTMEKIKFENKLEFRLHARTKLSQTSNCYKRDKVISRQILELISRFNPHAILLYMPLAIEPNIHSVLVQARKKCDVFVPFMEGISFKMVKYRLPLDIKRFNIREPKNSFALKPKIDLAIVPVIGVDGALKRIGFGKGMYDRFFDSLTPRPTTVFVQRDVCMTPTLLGEEHDIEADIYLTPYHIIIQRGHNGLRVTSGRCGSSQRRSRVFHRQKDGSSEL